MGSHWEWPPVLLPRSWVSSRDEDWVKIECAQADRHPCKQRATVAPSYTLLVPSFVQDRSASAQLGAARAPPGQNPEQRGAYVSLSVRFAPLRVQNGDRFAVSLDMQYPNPGPLSSKAASEEIASPKCNNRNE